MALDPYKPCPGGTNKKIKFCGCDKEVLGDLNKIVDAIGGEQRAAALMHANRSLEAHGNRACLLTLKGSVQMQLNDFEGLFKTAEVFLQAHPENCVALGMSAISAAQQGDSQTALTQLQRALQKSDGTIQGMVYAAIGIVGRVLLDDGNILSAFGHFLLQMSFSDGRDEQSKEIIAAVCASERIPIFLKQEMILDAKISPAVPTEEFGEALRLAHVGRWVEACARFYSLDAKHADEPALVKNMAILQGWLGDETSAGESWRRYAAMPGVDLDSAVEAEALAQMLLYSEDMDHQVDQVAQSYPISDTERVLEILQSEKHVSKMPIDLAELAREDSPPPKGAFWLLDRAVPTEAAELQFSDVPNVLGEMYLYGRQTDREARVEFVALKSADFESKLRAFKKLLGEYAGAMEKEENAGQVSATSAALTWQWRLPDDVTPEQRQRLIELKRRDVSLNVWPQTPLRELDGQTPLEAAADPANRIRLLASILVQEVSAEPARGQFGYDEVRAKLNLPVETELDPTAIDITLLPPTRLHRLPADKLPDEKLYMAFTRAYMFRAVRALRALGLQLAERTTLNQKIDRSRIYDLLRATAVDFDEALDFNTKARAAAVALQRSPAKWMIEEMRLRLLKGDAEIAQQLLIEIQQKHLREPGVGEMLYRAMASLGLIRPNGGGPGPEAAEELGGPGPAPPAPGKIWTPGSDTAAPTGEKKPSLWVPGMG